MKLLNLLLVIFLAASAQQIFAQGTAFTYQGSLKNDGTPANGLYDFEFSMFDSVSGNGLVGVILVSGVVVTNGVFSVNLNFGNQYQNPNRFLDIKVRQNGGGAFTTLTPRQPLTSTPYSVQSLNAATATNASNAVLAANATNAAQLGGISASGFIQNTTIQQSSTNFNVGGTGTANIFNAATQFNLGGSRVFAVPNLENTFVGINAGLLNTSSVGNTFFGNSAGANNTTGGQNSLFGAKAGQMNNATGNSFFGYDSGTSTTSGGDNSFFGAGAGDSNTTASFNSFFGRSAGGANTVGVQNAFFGRQAGFLNVSGNNNSFFGFEAGRATTANGNSFFGSQSGLLNTTGTNNSFFGVASGGDNTEGSDNAFFGVNAGRGNTNGIQNTFIGRLAGRFNLLGDNNTFVGYNTGSANTFGRNNTIVGANANLGFAGLDFATAIGAGAVVTEDNTVVIGRTNDKVHVKGTLLVNDLLETSFAKFQSSFTINYTELTTPGNNNACWGFDGIFGFYFGKCGSSSRFKTNVNELKSGVDLIRRLRPVTFDWKSDGKSAIGLIAEEVNEIEPMLAVKGKDDVIESVHYESVTVVLVNAVKEQQTTIESLETKIVQQTDAIKQQKEKLDTQEELLAKQRAELNALRRFICSTNPAAELCQPTN